MADDGHRPVPAHAEPGYLTTAQVAELLQVSAKSVYRWAATDASMPVLRIGGTTRFHRERLFAWLARREPRASRKSAASSADQRKTPDTAA